MNDTTAEFQRTAATLNNSYSSAVKAADSAIAAIARTIRQATEDAQRFIATIRAGLLFDYKVSLVVLSSSALVLGPIPGYFMNDWTHPVPRRPACVTAPAAQVAAQSPAQPARKKRNAPTPLRETEQSLSR